MDDLVKKIESYEMKIAEKQKERDRLIGRLDAAKQQLNDAGFETVEDAEAWLEKENVRLEEAEAELRADMEEFDNEYAEDLEG